MSAELLSSSSVSAGSVRWDEETGMWTVSGFAEIGAVLRGTGWSSDPARQPGAPQALRELPPGNLLFTDPPDHTRLRRLLAPAFTPRAIEPLRHRVTAIVEAVLDGLDDETDLLRDVAYLIPVAVIAELLDVGADGAELLLELTPRLVRILEFDSDDEAILAGAAASVELIMFLTPLLAERQKDPGEDFISAMLAVPGGLTPGEVANICILLLTAGHETTANLMASSSLALLEGRADREALLADPVRSVEELLRCEGPVKQLFRTAAEPQELGGHHIAEGEAVRLLVREANLAQAPLDLRRDTLPHLAFGGGMHYCLGAGLARMEAIETLPRLFTRYPSMTLRSHAWRDSTTFHALDELRVSLGG